MAKKSKQSTDKPPWEKKTVAPVPKVNPDDVTIITAADPVERVKAQVFGGNQALFADESRVKGLSRNPAVIGATFLILAVVLWFFFHRGAKPDSAPEEGVAPVAVQQPPQEPIAPVPSRLRVFSMPPGARVFLKGKNLGVTPVEIENLTDGVNYSLSLQKEGYETKEVSVLLQAGEIRDLRLDLLAEMLHIRVRSNPDQAEVWLDGKLQGKTPLEVSLEPKPKQVKIELRKEGYQPFIKMVPVRNPLLELDQKLAPQAVMVRHGYLTLESEPWAIVYVNDKRLNRITPIKDYQLPEGNYQIRFENPQNKKRRTEKVQLKANQHLRLRVKLR